MVNKYQVALKALRSVTARIDNSLPSPEVMDPQTKPILAPALDGASLLPALQGHVSAFDRRIKSAHTLVTPKGSIGSDKLRHQDGTRLLLPRKTAGTDLIYDGRWRRLASVYYLPVDIAIGYMCIPQRTSGRNQTSQPIDSVVLGQITDDARNFAKTFDTHLILSIGSLSGFEPTIENAVASGDYIDQFLTICLVNLGPKSGFICEYSYPAITWGVPYFIPESSGQRLEEVKQEIRGLVNTPGESASRIEISSILDCSLNYVDLAFIDLIANWEYEILIDPTDGPTLRRQNQNLHKPF
jgi:hypothetical protein